MKRMLLAGWLLLFGVGAWAQNGRVDGCLAVQGTQYVLLQGNNTRYLLQGKQDELKRHVGQLVRIEGRPFQGKSGGGLTVTGIDSLQPNCTMMGPSGSATDAIAGKTGNEGVAIPDTTTSSAGQTTPGYQTPAGIAQQPGESTQPSTAGPRQSRNQPGAPPNWENAGQNPASANTMAEAAERAEIQPGAPIGTKPAAPGSAGEQPQSKVPRTEAGTQQDRIIQITNGACVPEKLTVRPGEAVLWMNHSVHKVHVATTNMTTATGENGSGRFASEFGPGQTFRQVFEQEGTYHYTCSEGNGQPKEAEIDVREE